MHVTVSHFRVTFIYNNFFYVYFNALRGIICLFHVSYDHMADLLIWLVEIDS